MMAASARAFKPAKTYESFAAAWPERHGEFAGKINSMPKYVVSSTLEEPLEWNSSTPIQGDVAEGVTDTQTFGSGVTVYTYEPA